MSHEGRHNRLKRQSSIVANVVVPRLGEELFPGSQRTFEVAESHVWFNKAVARWLDIALYKGEL